MKAGYFLILFCLFRESGDQIPAFAGMTREDTGMTKRDAETNKRMKKRDNKEN